MLNPRVFALAVVAGLVGCGPLVPFVPDTARLPPGGLSGIGFNPDVQAVYQAQWAFAVPSRTHGRPIEAARAAADMDYIAGELYTSPRWANISAITKMQLLQGRQEVRETLGASPTATSQQIVDSLSGAANALASNDQAAAVKLLGAPVFLPGGEEVLARLSNLPYLQEANISTMHAAGELFQNDGSRFDF